MSPGKRVFDLLGAGVAALLLWPLFLLIAALIKLGDGGPVFFRQIRIGRYGKPFRMWKFRTMVADAERRGSQLTIGQDPRITLVGRLLRKSKLDELPQLLNVLVGEMSLVGPRPEVPHYVGLYHASQRRVLDLAPGMTDPASIAYNNESSILENAEDSEKYYTDVIMPDKIRISLEYASEANLIRDVKVILATVGVLIRAPRRNTSPRCRPEA